MTSGTIYQRRIDIPTRYSLLNKLQNWADHESWRVFFDTYSRMIHSLALRAGLNEIEAQEVVQETIISVAKDIHKFKPDPTLGSFRGWLRKIVTWRVVDQFRKRPVDRRKSNSTGGGTPPELTEIPDTKAEHLESLWNAEWEANLFEAALNRVKRHVREEHFQIFDLYALKGWPVLKVARGMGVSVTRIYVIKHRITNLIKKEVQELEKGLI